VDFTSLVSFFKNGPNPASFGLFSFFLHDKYSTNTLNDKSIDGAPGIQTRDGRMVGADKSTELYQHPKSCKLVKLRSYSDRGPKLCFSNLWLEDSFITSIQCEDDVDLGKMPLGGNLIVTFEANTF